MFWRRKKDEPTPVHLIKDGYVEIGKFKSILNKLLTFGNHPDLYVNYTITRGDFECGSIWGYSGGNLHILNKGLNDIITVDIVDGDAVLRKEDYHHLNEVVNLLNNYDEVFEYSTNIQFVKSKENIDV